MLLRTVAFFISFLAFFCLFKLRREPYKTPLRPPSIQPFIDLNVRVSVYILPDNVQFAVFLRNLTVILFNLLFIFFISDICFLLREYSLGKDSRCYLTQTSKN